MYSYHDHIPPIKMTLAQAQAASHPGQCDEDVKALTNTPAIRRQLARIPDADLIAELRETGAWTTDELTDRDTNEQRIIWIAAGQIADEADSK